MGLWLVESNVFPVEDVLTSGDLTQGHNSLTVENVIDHTHTITNSLEICQLYQLGQNGPHTLQKWQSQISNTCCDLGNKVKVKHVVCP